MKSTTLRLCFLAIVFASAHIVLKSAAHQESVPPSADLRTFPEAIAAWQGAPLPAFDARTMGVLGVDEYINRAYRTSTASPSVDLYVGYYKSQRIGDVIHSPLNCLPGSGWEPIESERLPLTVGTNRTNVNRLIVQRGDDRMLVVYWYQERGRIIASEYAGKLFTALDAAWRHRTDGALVRITSRLENDGDAGRASGRVLDFVRSMFPLLDRYIPA